jgi:transcriptional regulator with XRE-family HTH domain
VRLSQARKNAGLTQEELAYRLRVERSTVGRWESGETEPSAWLRPKLAKLLGVKSAELGELLVAQSEVHHCSAVRSVPPPLAERDHFTLALEDAGRYLDDTVAGYFERQLDVCVADDGTHGPTRTLPAVLGVVKVVEQHARQVKSAVRRRLLTVGARGAEFAGWLYRDANQPDLALYWRDRAVEWAQEAGDWSMQGYILLKKSQSAWDGRDAVRMLTLAQAGPWTLSPLVRAEAANARARARVRFARALAVSASCPGTSCRRRGL